MTTHTLLSRLWTRVRRAYGSVRLRQPGPQMVSAQPLADQAFLNLFALEKVSTFLRQKDIGRAGEALIMHYARRESPPWPEPPNALTDMRLEIDTLSPQALIRRADAVLDYQVSPIGPGPKLLDDGRIDWCFNPTSNQEWIWRLNRHQWWPLLGLAYRQSGDERYASVFVAQMLDWVAANPPIPDKDEKSPTWRLMEVGQRMSVSWIPVFGLFYASPSFTSQAKLTMLRAIYDHARFLSLFHTNRNHLLRECNGLAAVSIYFPEFSEAQSWQTLALNRLDREIIAQVNQDGSHIEVSTGYQWLVVDELEKTFDLLQAANQSLPTQDLSAMLKKMYKVLAHISRPDGSFPELNDGFLHWQIGRLANAGQKFSSDALRYVGTGGSQGTPPPETSIAFPDAGLFVMRSDWRDQARYLLFDAGPFGGPHGHEDKLSVEVFAYGQPFIVDSGSYTYNAKDALRTYFVGSEGHNTVLVDRLSQVRRWHKANLRPTPARGNYATWVSRPDFDYVVSSYQDGYGRYQMRPPKAPQILSDVVHTRQILFVKPNYWLMVDHLSGPSAHLYEAVFHIHPDVSVDLRPDGGAILHAGPDKGRLQLFPANANLTQTTLYSGAEGAIQSWHSAEHHQKRSSKAVVFSRKDVTSTHLITLLYPSPPGQMADAVEMELLSLEQGEGVAVMISGRQGQDWLILSQNEGRKQVGPYTADSPIAAFRTDKDGKLLKSFDYNPATNS